MILVVSFQKAFSNEKKESIDNKIVLKESELKISPLFYAGWAYGSESPIAILLGLKFNGGIEYGTKYFASYIDGGFSLFDHFWDIHLEVGFRIHKITFDYSVSQWTVTKTEFHGDWTGLSHNINIGFQIPISKKTTMWIKVGKNLSRDLKVSYSDLSTGLKNAIDLGWNFEIRIGISRINW